MKDYIEKFSEYLKYELNYSDNTIREYILHLNSFNEYIILNKINYFKMNKNDIMNYLKFLDSQKLNNRSIGNILSSLRCFYDYLIEINIVNNNIFRSISNPKMDKKLPNFLSEEDMRKILDSINCEDVLSYRNRMIIEILYACGLRVSELVNIKLSDINMADKTIKVLGKGNKERIVFFGDYAYEAINNYLSVRNIDNEYLVLNNNGNKITSRGIEKIINNIIEKACISNHASPHTFRHTFATHMLNNGCPLKSVQEFLGHSSLSSTEVYTHITSDFLKSEYLKNMPRK